MASRKAAELQNNRFRHIVNVSFPAHQNKTAYHRLNVWPPDRADQSIIRGLKDCLSRSLLLLNVHLRRLPILELGSEHQQAQSDKVHHGVDFQLGH